MKSKKLGSSPAAEDELKALVDILRDKQIVRITASTKIYSDLLPNPQSILVDSERGREGNDRIWNSIDPNSTTLSREGLLRSLATIDEKVRQYILENQLATVWTELEESISKSKATIENLEYHSELPILAIAASGYQAHLCAPIIATVCVREGAESNPPKLAGNVRFDALFSI